MRSEKEMYNLILEIARCDERVRAVILNGSRANPNARRDFFQDFDIVYVVTEVASFLVEPNWIDCFGERMILQLPDRMGEATPRRDGGFCYLIQFIDGNRIDLTLLPLASLADRESDSLSVLLLDKDGRVPPFPPTSEQDYLPKPPTHQEFDDCCNEFWWVCPYVAKGLWREEILYAKGMLEQAVRPELIKMLTWYAGSGTGFTRSTGKYGKYLPGFLAPELWEQLLKTYPDADYENTWQALLSMTGLFREAALEVARAFGYDYPRQDDERVSAHLRHVYALPRDAPEMYP